MKYNRFTKKGPSGFGKIIRQGKKHNYTWDLQ